MKTTTKVKKEISKVVPLKKFYSQTKKQFEAHKEWMSMSNKMKQKNWSKSDMFVDFGQGILGYYSDKKGLLEARKGKGYYLRVATPAGNSIDYKVK